LLREDQGAVTYPDDEFTGQPQRLVRRDAGGTDSGVPRRCSNRTTSRVIVLRGVGKAFCAGHDLKEMTAKRQANDGGAAGLRDLFDRCAVMMQMIQRLPQPVIARRTASPRPRAASWSRPAIWRWRRRGRGSASTA
jgi:hypothetical protein